ncbi:MAG: iduronate sulfatase [Candidatus Fluviicola riflensis]|nr:MAG: YqaE/Pmp3 family membrane protein [Candidatus Fluviicola riflensis]OGS79940.1 MAG: iduronate sulfatase [Candidatus Fluviicola riflensis]OGS82455.1 MAG: iduronate sulfatase [Fluviicola sp. RIFCSPHIGHO2_01_FULL_43_53]OGS88119.1 MAG: iduronate sulfatase [Fluviicola sp. RIFCSPHIGHO2_12_FULL_43_24]
MKYVIAFFLPWLSLMIQGKILSGMLCLLLQLTLIGWIPAFIWAITSLNRMYADRRTQEIIKAIKEEKSNYYKF